MLLEQTLRIDLIDSSHSHHCMRESDADVGSLRHSTLRHVAQHLQLVALIVILVWWLKVGGCWESMLDYRRYTTIIPSPPHGISIITLLAQRPS
jgi:hypothetical protein